MRLGFGAFYGRHAITRRAGVFDCAVRDADPVRTVVRHSHDDAHFVLVLDGLYASSARGAPALASDPILIFNPPGTTHRDRFETTGGPIRGQFLTISVQAGELDRLGAGRRLRREACAVTDPDAVRCAGRLARETLGRSATGTLALEAGALDLLGAVTTADRDHRDAPSWLSGARERMLDAPSTPVTVAELADEAGVHPVHFARVFRRVHGTGPAAFMRQHRVELAIALLRQTRRPIGEIAAATGYVDQSHLHRAVRRRTGVTPGVVRGQPVQA